MLRSFVIAAALLPVIGAQTVSTAPAPLEVTGSLVPTTGGPVLSATIQTNSDRAIQGFVYETIFTDAETGRLISTWPRGCYKKPSSGTVFAPGDGPLIPRSRKLDSLSCFHIEGRHKVVEGHTLTAFTAK
jgi:hypothetical protein